MAKCFNCDNDSVYIINNEGALPQEFCDTHLPKFLTRTNLPPHVKYVNRGPVDAPAKTSKKKAAPKPTEEPEAEE